MKTKYEEFRNIEDLEFGFFKELDIKEDENDSNEDIKEKISDLFSYHYNSSLNLIDIIKIVDRRIIGYNINGRDNYIVFNEILNLKVGDMINFSKISDEEAEIIKIDEEILNEEFLKGCKKKLKGSEISIDRIKVDVLKREDIEKEIEKVVAIIKTENKEAKKREKVREKEVDNLKEKYEKDGLFQKNNLKVSDKTIEDNYEKIILDKKVNKVLDYHYITYGYLHIKGIRNELIQKKENFTYEYENKEIKYKVEFENNPKKKIIQSLTDGKDTSIAKINGVKVRKNKIQFILDRINKDTTKEQIKILSKLTGMKANTLELKEISVKGVKAPIEFSLIDENNFGVDFLGKRKRLGWNEVKDFFFYNESRSIISYYELRAVIKIGEYFGLKKQEVYDYLKRVVMVDELNKGNENEN